MTHRVMTHWALEGGGPWMVLEDCPALRHCTNSAARSKEQRGSAPCVCPRALYLREQDLQRQRAAARVRRIEAGQPAEPSGSGRAAVPQWFQHGPWRISPLCNASGHNNVSWARGTGGKKCTCPRALYILEKYKESRRKIERAERATTRSMRTRVVPPKKMQEPDWQKAACRTNVRIAERGFNEDVSRRGIADRQAAKDLCTECPAALFAQCKTWIKFKEGHRPGELGGVYAGMDKWNRQGTDLQSVDGKIKRVSYEPSEV